MEEEVTITDRAAEKINGLLTGAGHGQGLRIKIVEGGCSGYEYKMTIDGPVAGDRVLEKAGARVLLDAISMLRLNGTELDYKDGLMQSGFVFNNPNVKGTCGCGTSFST